MSTDLKGPENKKIRESLDQWRRDLIDLSRRNRLINLQLTGRGSTIELVQPSFTEILDRLQKSNGAGWRFHYPPPDPEDLKKDDTLAAVLSVEDPDLSPVVDDDELLTNIQTAKQLSTKLRTMFTKSSSELLDKGLRVLYLTVGMLNWNDGDTRDLSSPLVLVPVELRRASVRDPFKLFDAEEDWVVNPALVAKLETEFQFKLPELDPDDLGGFLAETAGLVRKQGWSVTETVALATLSFAKETIYRDLIDNEEEIKSSAILQAIILGGASREELSFDGISSNSEELDRQFPPEALNSILDADGTQRACIVAAREGRSFVMDGPPGSGKSQTISNIIAELLGAGKTVLFVSEKAAALDVVKKRLDAAHLGEFVIELHSHKATRSAFARELGQSLRRRLDTRRFKPVDTAQLGRNRKELSEYAAALNESRQFSESIRSLHDAIGRCGQLDSVPTLGVTSELLGALNGQTLSRALDAAEAIARAWGPVARGDDFLWRDLADGTLAMPSVQLHALLEQAVRSTRELQVSVDRFVDDLELGQIDDLETIRKFTEINALLDSRPSTSPQWLLLDDLLAIRSSLLECTAAAARVADLNESIRASGVEPSEAPEDPSAYLDAVSHCSSIVSKESTRGQVRKQSSASKGLSVLAARMADRLADLHSRLGLVRNRITHADAVALIELADVSKTSTLPLSSWLDSASLGRIKQVRDEIEPEVRKWQQIEVRLRTIFNENLEKLDIEAMFESLSDVNLNVNKFSARGRKNRKQLKAASTSGKVSRDVIAAVPEIRTWREISRKIEQTPGVEKLGAYFQGGSTDLEMLGAALSIADNVLKISSPIASTDGLSRLASRDRIDTSLVQEVRDEIEQYLREWGEIVQESVVHPTPSSVDSLLDIASEHWNAAELLDRLVSEMTNICDDDSKSVALMENVARWAIQRAELTRMIETSDLRDHLRPAFVGLETNWEGLGASIDWSIHIRALLPSKLRPEVADALCSVGRHDRFEAAWVAYLSGIREVECLFQEGRRDQVRQFLNDLLSECERFIDQLRNSTSDIAEWDAYSAARADLVEIGLVQVVEHAESTRQPPQTLALAVEKAILNGWVESIVRSDPRLKTKRRLDRDAVLSEFRSLDRALRERGIARVIEVCEARRPSAIKGEFQIIDRESLIKRKHMPIRTLLGQAGSAALDIKPCFMMSPLSVSQFLPPTMKFDCVIFDEASQVKPSDAINALYRGRQTIIAGDERQLPPTSFFDRAIVDDDEYNEDDVPIFESILGLSKSGLCQLPLRWHYRSRHEDLISFSNREFYDSELVTYPGAIHESPELGVHFEFVEDGIYDRGGGRHNVIEARRVVERVLHHARKHPNLSLGVVALSDAQASRIAYELEAQRRDLPELDEYFAEDRLDGFFVKNLESIQGDERDIIIFSIGYGKDENGKFTMNFGPVGQSGGERRLNVAITRARQRVEVVSSIRASDFLETSNARLLQLKRYLRFAEEGRLVTEGDGLHTGEIESPFEQDVVNVIKRLGYVPHSQVGQAGYRIDVGVVHPMQPGRYCLGVECDGATYHSSRVARDRDRLRQDVLEGLGWTIHRIWSTAWFEDRQTEIGRLRDAIVAATRADKPTFTSRVESRTPAPQSYEIEEEVAPWAEIYQPRLKGVKKVQNFDNPNSGIEVRDMIRSIVENLAPIHPDQIESFVREIQDFGAMSVNRKTIVSSALAVLKRRNEIKQDRHGFVWMPDSMTVVVRAGDPNHPTSVRKPAHVSPDEVKLALFFLLKDAKSMDPDSLVREVARVFGWRRTGADVRDLVEAALANLVKRKDVEKAPGGRLVAASHEYPNLD